MATLDKLENDAWTAYEEGKFSEALMGFIQSSELALELRDEARWHECRVYAAECYVQVGKYIQAMNFLLEARLNEPNNRSNNAAWMACKKTVEIALSSTPFNSKITSFINELKALYAQQAAQASDVLHLEGKILFERGLLVDALAKSQEAWSCCRKELQGYHISSFAILAAFCCLRLKYIEQAKDWINSLENALQNTGQNTGWFAKHGELKIHLALLETQPFSCLPGQLRQLDDQTQLSQEKHDAYNMLAVRVALLTNSDLDPMQPSHPSRPPLMQRLRNAKNVHYQYGYRLLLLDVRLAALRFCAGIAPVDDLYYAKPQQFSVMKNDIDINKLQLRVRKALQTARQAERYGAKIDSMLECDWRQKEVRERRIRIMDIARHHNLDAEISEAYIQ